MMPSIRSKRGQIGERETWSLALLVAATLILTSQALGIGISERLLVALLTTLAASFWALQLAACWRQLNPQGVQS